METKESQLLIKVEKSLKDAFLATCKERDTTAAREIRSFMRDYLKKHGQKSMF